MMVLGIDIVVIIVHRIHDHALTMTSLNSDIILSLKYLERRTSLMVLEIICILRLQIIRFHMSFAAGREIFKILKAFLRRL